MDHLTRIQLVRDALASGRSSGNQTRCPCPFCLERKGSTDHRSSFSFNEAKQAWWCHRCKAAGYMADGPRDAEGQYLDLSGVPPCPMPEDWWRLDRPPGEHARGLAPARAYLEGRGINPWLWTAAKIGACGRGLAGGRVVIPIEDQLGVCRGWVGRAWVKKHPFPYRYADAMPRGQMFFNHAALLVETEVPLAVVEGAFDVLALWPDAIALLGGDSEWQREQLAAAPRPIVVTLDPDAQQDAKLLAWRLRAMDQRVGLVELPYGRDPDEVEQAGLREAMAESLETRHAVAVPDRRRDRAKESAWG